MSNSSISSSRYIGVLAAGAAVAVLGFILAFRYLPGPTPETNGYLWAGEMRIGKERAASTEKGARVLVYGGSEVYFGISAQTMTKLVGVPSFNMGTHAGNGLGMPLNDALNFARPRDTVIFSIVPTHLFGQKSLVTVQAKSVDKWLGGQYFRTASLREKFLLLLHASVSDVLTFGSSAPQIDRRRGYWQMPPDRFGDVRPLTSTEKTKADLLAQLQKLPDRSTGYAPPRTGVSWSIPDFLWPDAAYPSVDPIVREALARVIRLMEANEIRVFFTLAPSTFANNPDTRLALEQAVGVERILTGVDMLPIELMYDTPYHPNSSGREKVTRTLADALCKRIDCRAG